MSQPGGPKPPVMSSGVAAFASSDMFKTPGYGKPKAKRWDHRVNIESKARKPSSLKSSAKYLATPGIISLGAGLPSSEYFPFERIDVKVPHPPHFSEEGTREFGVVKSAGKHDIAEGTSLYDLHVALNYCQGTGSGQMLRFVTEHTEIVHHPPYQDWQCNLTSGSTSALDLAYRMFTTRGEYVLTEEYAYSSAVEKAAPLGVKFVGVKMDAEGLLPSDMDSILTTWDPSIHGDAPKPWLLYTVPTGQNPTGSTQSEQRRREIYRVAQKHDVYILEDEPYYFLQMQTYTGSSKPSPPPPSSHREFLSSLVPSFLSMDIDGRVMRLDSFSKLISPGSRMGWVTASAQIIERFLRHCEVSSHSPSGISQIVLYKLLEETWGHGGYFDWLIHLRMEYTQRRDNICYACERFLPREVASWKEPMAGIFHWIKINWTVHPQAAQKGKLVIEEEIFQESIARGVLLVKGSCFLAEANSPSPGTPLTNDNGAVAASHDISFEEVPELFFRATFAAVDQEKVTEAIRRFGDTLREVFGLE
ncbi:Aromatic/aminoadipate aminotransferase 1 [Lobaria immixta]|nr:Aromatic/aminoadipate aminotransferase 1 [Lobaria immixta]